MFVFKVSAGLKAAAVLSVALALGACASNKTDQAGGMAGLYGAGASTPGSAQDFVVNVGDRIFFDTDSTSLNNTGIATLEQQIVWLQRYPHYTFLIEGHADERGTREYNYALGARRAQTVYDYMTSRGVGSNRMRVVSYGKERPIAVCNDISCWSQNRRAVTVLDRPAGG